MTILELEEGQLEEDVCVNGRHGELLRAYAATLESESGNMRSSSSEIFNIRRSEESSPIDGSLKSAGW